MDWGGAEGAADPCLAAVKLLHVARQSAGTSRWWTMRWPQNAVSLIDRAGKLSPGKTYKRMRALRKHALNYLDQLWMLTSDRRHEKDTTALLTELKADWCLVQKLLGRSRDKAGNFMPGWIIVQRRSTYVITRQLTRWTQLFQLRVSGGSQRFIKGYFSRVPPPPKPARPGTAAPTAQAAAPLRLKDAADVSLCARRLCTHGRASPVESRVVTTMRLLLLLLPRTAERDHREFKATKGAFETAEFGHFTHTRAT